MQKRTRQQIGKYSRQKGARAERELAHILSSYGFPCERSAQRSGKTGVADVLGLPYIHIECKHVENLNIHNAIEQAIGDKKPYNTPVVFHKKNRKRWLCTMTLEDFMDLYMRSSLPNETN